MSEIGQTYYGFWASLLPQSNRQTGFSLRSPTRRSSVEYCHVGFCFRYRLEYDQGVTLHFTLRRKNATTRRFQCSERYDGAVKPETHIGSHQRRPSLLGAAARRDGLPSLTGCDPAYSATCARKTFRSSLRVLITSATISGETRLVSPIHWKNFFNEAQ